MNPASTMPPAAMLATSTPSTICCTKAPGISSCISPKTRVVLAVSTNRSRIREVSENRVRSHPLWGDGHAQGLHSAAHRMRQRVLGDPPSGSRSPLQSPLRSDFHCDRYRLQSLSLLARCACQEGSQVRASIAGAVPGGTAEGGCARNKQILLRRDGSLCHTCSLRQPRLRRGPPLRCAPLRPGLGMKRR